VTADSITASIVIDAPAEIVFDYFTQTDAIVGWMGEFALLEPEPGGTFEVNILGTPVRGRYLLVDRPNRLRISWGYAGSDDLPPGASTVEITLTPVQAGTLVELVHSGLKGRQPQEHVVGWTHYLARLQSAVRGGGAGVDRGMPAA